MSEIAEWLDDTVPAGDQAIVRRAMCDIGIVEMPPGSNRSPRIDEYVAAVGSPVGSRWCAAAVAAGVRCRGSTVECRQLQCMDGLVEATEYVE